MKKGLKQGMIALSVCMCLGGCGKEAGEITATTDTNTEEVAQMAADNDQSESTDYFPESYSEQTEKVKFDCLLEVPENFKASEFRVPIIKGSFGIDAEAAYAKYVEGKVITEEYHDPATGENDDVRGTYVLEDGTLVGIGVEEGGFIYTTPKASTYRTVVRATERSAPKDNLAFATGDNCTEQVREELKAIGWPMDEFQFGWFSTSGEDYAILEQRALDDGAIDSQNAKQDGWTEADDAYEIYGWQVYEGLQVFPTWMTTGMSRAVENYQKAPVSALYTEQGILNLSLTYPPYIFEASDEISQLLPFSEIADVLIQKYNDLLDDAVYTVFRAKLVLRTYFDEKQQLTAEPVWYFEVTNGSSREFLQGGSVEVVLVNAVTGMEIFLN